MISLHASVLRTFARRISKRKSGKIDCKIFETRKDDGADRRRETSRKITSRYD